MTKKARISLLLLGCGVALVFGGAGCKKKEPVPVPPPAAPQKQPAKAAQKQVSSAKNASGLVQPQRSSAQRTTSRNNFDFTNRKDPFKPYAQPSKPVETRQAVAIDRRRPE